MERQQYMISRQQKKWIKEEADRKGVSMSEILRAAIDAYFAQNKGGADGTQR